MIGAMKKFFTENFWLKVLSLLLAFILWVAITGEKKNIVEIIVNSNIEFQNVPGNLEVISFFPPQVRVRLRLQKVYLSKVDTREVAVRLDLSNARAGEELIMIKKNMIVLPVNAEILSISPSYVRVKLEEIVEKEVPVKPVLVGMTPKWLNFKGYKIVPEKVRIKGARTVIERTSILYTEPLDLSLLSKKKRFRLNVMPKSPLISIVRPIDGFVVVEVLAEEKIVKKSFVLNDKKYTIKVELEGPVRLLESLKPEEIKYRITGRSGREKVKFDLPEEIKVLSVRVNKR